MCVEKFDQFREVGQRTGEAVDLVDDDDVDLPGSHVIQKRLKGRPDEGAAREGSVIEVTGNERPALMGLALDIGLAGFPLGVEGVEGEIEVMIGGLACVDGAAHRLHNGWLHFVPLMEAFDGRGRSDDSA